jgi:hypothetical protein
MAGGHLHALPSGFEFEGYRVEHVLGAGGFGITYKAEETLIRRPVAIKEYMPRAVAGRSSDSVTVLPLHATDADQFHWGLKRFRNEARTLVNFRHDNIVAVYRYFQANETAYLVMAYEDGMTLQQILRKAGTLPEYEIREVLDPLLGGVAEVHAAGFLHRDIKPGNIMIRPTGAPVLIDFGAARLALGEKSHSTRAVLSPGYAPFEQYTTGSEQGPFTDIYALGATLYACVTGKPPPPAPDRVAGTTMPKATEAGAGAFSENLLRAIDHALAIQPEDRPRSIAAWSDELDGKTSAVPSPSVATPTVWAPSVGAPTVWPPAVEAPAPTTLAAALATPETDATASPVPAVPPQRRRYLWLAVVALMAIAGGAGAYEATSIIVQAQREHDAEEARRKAAEAEKQRQEAARRAADEKRAAQEKAARQRATDADSQARAAQAKALAAERQAYETRHQARSAADCAKTAATRGRSQQTGYYSGKMTDGSKYEGGLDSSRRKSGCGILEDANGNRYEGQFSGGYAAGYGVQTLKNGTVYEGGFKRSLWDGFGVATSANGDVDVGTYANGRMNGPGRLVKTSGYRYEGDLRDNNANGYGVFQKPDGTILSGQWIDAKFTGYGIMTDASGKTTYGRWEDGVYKGAE